MNKFFKMFLITLISITMVSGCGTSADSSETVEYSEQQKENEVEETLEETVEEEPIEEIPLEEEEILPEPELIHKITVGETYHSYNENMNADLFANIFTNIDGSISFEGFGYTDGIYDDSLRVDGLFTPVIEGSNEYNSYTHSLIMNQENNSFEIFSDESLFFGYFTILTEEPTFDIYNGAPTISNTDESSDESDSFEIEETDDDIIYLSVDETPEFFRDINNIGKKFSCLMFYRGTRQGYVGNEEEPVYSLYYKHVNGTSFMALATGVTGDIFYEEESVRITGTYLGASPDPSYEFLFDLDSIVLEDE